MGILHRLFLRTPEITWPLQFTPSQVEQPSFVGGGNNSDEKMGARFDTPAKKILQFPVQAEFGPSQKHRRPAVVPSNQPVPPTALQPQAPPDCRSRAVLELTHRLLASPASSPLRLEEGLGDLARAFGAAGAGLGRLHDGLPVV